MAKDKENLEGKKHSPEEEEEESVNQPPEPYRETLEKLQKEKDDQ